ncbi:MAG: hypothetical protein J0I32_05005 [Sphingobacteriales bacterium]|nr:hypothetical protein [Sphingobacteriales bacterium]OJV98515.1 MAG: hypothetical protein BGO52_12100 [Sphingobacteriales bacterium 44-61]
MKPENVEIILNELLEGQRNQASLQSETVMLCREFAMQLMALKKPDEPEAESAIIERLKMIQMDCKAICDQQVSTDKRIHAMAHQLTRLETQTRKTPGPFDNQWRFLKRWKKWLSAGFAILFFLPLILLTCKTKQVEKLKAGDLKYQYLKAYTDSSSQAMLTRLDSAYIAAPDSLRRLIKLAANTKKSNGYAKDSSVTKQRGKDGVKTSSKRLSK